MRVWTIFSTFAKKKVEIVKIFNENPNERQNSQKRVFWAIN